MTYWSTVVTMKKTQALISKCRHFSKQYRAFCSDPSASLHSGHSALQSMRRSSSASAISWKIKYLDLCAEMWMHTLALMTLMRMRKSPKSKVNPLLVEFHLTKGINMTHAACWISCGRVSSYANFPWCVGLLCSNWKSTKHWWFSDSDLHW